MTTALPKPQPAPERDPLTVQVVTRLTETSRERVRKLAEAEGVSIQQLGIYAWSLALQSYGQKPLDEVAA